MSAKPAPTPPAKSPANTDADIDKKLDDGFDSELEGLLARKDKDGNVNKDDKMFIVKLTKMLFSCCLPIPPPRSRQASKKPSTPGPTPAAPTGTNPRNKFRKLGPIMPSDAEITEIFDVVKEDLLDKINMKLNEEPQIQKIQATEYRAQTIIGINYFTKVKLDDGPRVIHAKIYNPVQGTPFVKDISDLKKETDDLEYF